MRSTHAEYCATSLQIRKATDGKGVDVIIDFVGQSYFKQNVASASKNPRFAGDPLTEADIGLSGLLIAQAQLETAVWCCSACSRVGRSKAPWN